MDDVPPRGRAADRARNRARLPALLRACLSSFITPKLLGGGRVFLLATEIYDQAITLLNWPLAATMSIIVLVIFGLALVLYTRILRVLD